MSEEPDCVAVKAGDNPLQAYQLGYTHGEATSRKAQADRIAKLEAAAARVCWFDWSTSNDADAVATIDELRRVLGKGNDQ